MDCTVKDDIEIIVQDTNVQLEIENKLVSDLMDSLEYEHEDQNDQVPLQEGKKESQGLSDCEAEHTKSSDALTSHGRNLNGVQYHGIPIVIVETEEEWKKRQFNEKTPGEKISSLKETAVQNIQNSKQKDLEFEIKTEDFQKGLSEVLNEGAHTQAKNEDVFSRTFEELESHMQSETELVSHSEEKNRKNIEDEFAPLRAGDKGHCHCETSRHEISCEASKGSLMTSNTSVRAQEFGPDSALSSREKALIGNSVLIAFESIKRSELVQADNGGLPTRKESANNFESSFLDDITENESEASENLVDNTPELLNKPDEPEDKKNSYFDIQGQNAGLSLISGVNFEKIDDVMPSEALEGAAKHEIHRTLYNIFDDEISRELDRENIIKLGDSWIGILSRNNSDDEAYVDLKVDPGGGNLEDAFESPVIVSNIRDDKKEFDLLDDEKKVTAGLDHDPSNILMSRKGEVRAENNQESFKNVAYSFSLVKDITMSGKDRINTVRNQREFERDEEKTVRDSDYDFKIEENLISFEDDDENVVVTAQEFPQGTVFAVTTVRNVEDNDKGITYSYDDTFTGLSHLKDGVSVNIRSNEAQTKFQVRSDILTNEKKSKAFLEESEKENKAGKSEGDVDKDGNFGTSSLSTPEIGMLVEIYPLCEEGTEDLRPVAAGIATGRFDNSNTNDSFEDQIIIDNQTCTDINTSVTAKKMDTISEVGDVSTREQSKNDIGKTMDKNGELRNSGASFSSKQVVERSCSRYDSSSSDSNMHEIRATVDNMTNCQKDEETKFEVNKTCGSTKRQREQAEELEVELKKLKIDERLDEEHSTTIQDKQKYLQKCQSSPKDDSSSNEEKIQLRKKVFKKEEYEDVVGKECYHDRGKLYSGENKDEQNTGDMEGNLFTSQGDSPRDKPENRDLINREETCDLENKVGTLECTTGQDTSGPVGAENSVPAVFDKSMESENFDELGDFNNNFISFDGTKASRLEEELASRGYHGDTNSTGDKTSESIVERKVSEIKVFLDNEDSNDGSCGRVEQNNFDFREKVQQYEVLLTVNCDLARNVGEAESVVKTDCVAGLSEDFNGLSIDGKDIKTEEKSGANPLVQETLDWRCHEDVTQDLKEDVTVKVTQDMKQEQQIYQKGMQAEKGLNVCVTQEEQRVTQDLRQDVSVTQDPHQECPEREKNLDMQIRVTQGTVQEELVTQRPQTLNSDVKQNLDVIDHLEEKMTERDQEQEKVTQGEKAMQDVTREVTQRSEDGIRQREITKEEKRVTQLEDKGDKTVQKDEDEVTQDSQEDIAYLKVTLLDAEKEINEEKDVMEEVDGVVTQPLVEKYNDGRKEMLEKEEEEIQDDGKNETRRNEREYETLELNDDNIARINSNDVKQETKLKDIEKEMQDLKSFENRIESIETKRNTREEEPSQIEKEIMEFKSLATGGEDVLELDSLYESEQYEDKESRIRSFEMLIHLEAIIKELEVYRSKQNRLRDSFKICMNEIMTNLSSMTNALQLLETRLNQKIKDAHEEVKKCCGTFEASRTTRLSMNALLKSYSTTQSQFGDLRRRVKDLEIICTALNMSEMQDQNSRQVSAEIDAMDKKVRFTENDVSDLKLRVTELESECSSLRKVTPVEERLRIQVGKKEVKIDRTTTRLYKYNEELNESGMRNQLGESRTNVTEDLLQSRGSPVIGPGQRYYGLQAEEV